MDPWEKETIRLAGLSDSYSADDIERILNMFSILGPKSVFYITLREIRHNFDLENDLQLLKFIISNIELALDASSEIIINNAENYIDNRVWPLFANCDKLRLIIHKNPILSRGLYSLKFTVLTTDIINEDIMKLNFLVLESKLLKSVRLIMTPEENIISNSLLHLCHNTYTLKFNSDLFADFGPDQHDLSVSLLGEVIRRIDYRIVRVKRAIN